MPRKTAASEPSESHQDGEPKVLHIVTLGKFIEPFINFVEENFTDFDRHIFFCFGDEELHPVRRRSNILFKSDFGSSGSAYLELFHRMYRSNKIILHGLWNIWVVRLLSIQPWLLPKCYWVIWGADLYDHKFADRSLMWQVKELSRRMVIKRIGHLITYVEADADLARQWYGARGQYHECLVYPSNLFKDYEIPAKTDSTTRIQIGNSADPGNEHFEMLKMLEDYKNEDIKIYAPLNYGPEEHMRKVAQAGSKIFGSKFVALTEFMRLDDYIEFLGRIDIAIFNHRRQQAMGNIVTLLGLGKKVFLRTDITSWDVFEKIGITLYDNSHIDLGQIDVSLSDQNRRLVKANFSSFKLKADLSEIFEA